MSESQRPAISSGVIAATSGAAVTWATVLAVIVLAVTVLVMAGCDRQRAATNPPAQPPAQPAAQPAAAPAIAEVAPPQMEPAIDAADSAQDAMATQEDSVEPVEEIDPTAATDDNRSVEDSSLEPGQPAQPTEAPTIAPFRLLLPTTAGPLLVDLDIQVGDQPLSDAFERRIELIIEQAGGADKLTWNELFEHIAANPQTFGRAMVDSQQYRNMIQMYDRNRNKRPEPDEVAHFLFRDSGVSGPFRMAGSNYFRQTNRTQSPMFRALDRNGNHVLDADEIRLAYQSLAQLDQNGDRRIDIAEVLPPTSDNNPTSDAWNNRRRSRWGDVAMDLGGYIDWSMVSYSLDEATRRGVFHEGQNAIAKLDLNGDETIDAEESRRLLEVPADIRLQIHFASSIASQPRIDMELSESEQRSKVETVMLGDRARIISDRFQLVAMVRDLRTGTNSIPPEAFAALDADKDGGLDQTEIPPGLLREYSFDDLDQDDDGKLTERELTEGMNPLSPVWTVQVRARGAEAPDAIFTWLDQDQNGLLSTRELLACRERLQGLASNQGEVRATDIPDTFLIQFGRGDPQQDASLFAVMPVATQRNETWPRWAESMDSNQDGEIAREEFLGQTEQFDELDRNGDGFLSGFEIE